MPSEENKALQSVLAPLMKAHGYRKSGATWHGVSSAFIRVLNIQGSYGDRHGLTLQVYAGLKVQAPLHILRHSNYY